MPYAFLEKAWELLEKEGLQGLTPERLAFYCDLSVLQVHEFFPTPLSILLGLWSFVENKAISLEPLPEASQDCLFEQMMGVLETLQPYRLAVRRLVDDLIMAPYWLKDMTPYAFKWSRQALERANISVKGVGGSLNTYSFAAFFFYILRVWANDDKGDNSLTMIKLDQGLTKLSEWLLKGESVIANLI